MWSLWCKTNVNSENDNDIEVTKVNSEDYFIVEEEEGNNNSNNSNDSQYLLSKIDLNDRLHKKELEFKDRQIAQKETKIKEITSRLQQCEREKSSSCAELKERLAKVEAELAKVKALCIEQSDALEQLKIDSSRKSEEISTLTRNLEDTEKQYKETVRHLTQELDESHQKIETLECSSFEPGNKKFAENETKKLLQDLNKTRQALSSKDRELQEALAKKNSLDSSLKQLQASKDKVEREYDWSRKHHQTMLNQANTSLKEKTEELEKLNSEIVQLKQEVEKEKVTTQDEIQRLLLEIDGKDLALNSAQSELQQIRKEINSKQHKGKRR